MRMLSALNLRDNSRVNIRYGEKFDSETYKLLEVEERLLDELFEDGLSIKGGPDDEAVLCTSKATYAMKFVSTSNTVLLVPPRLSMNSASDIDFSEDSPISGLTTGVEGDVNAAATAAGHIELVEISPKVENLKALLSQRLYNEDVDDDETDVEDGEGLYTWDDLLARVQASEFQLRTALKTLQAVEIGGYWRLADEEFLHRLLEMLLLTTIQHDWPLDALPGPEVVQGLGVDNYSAPIVIHCLNTFGVRTDSEIHDNPSLLTRADNVTDLTGTITDDDTGTSLSSLLWVTSSGLPVDQFFCLPHERSQLVGVARALSFHFRRWALPFLPSLARYYANSGSDVLSLIVERNSYLAGAASRWALDEEKVCLQYAKRLLASNSKWKLQEFMESWQRALPAGMNPRLQMLGGEALVDVVGPEPWLYQFSISSLPRKPEARFAALFKRRAKWEWDDLEPYLRDLKQPNQSVEAMLLKYTRKTQPSANLPPIYTTR